LLSSCVLASSYE